MAAPARSALARASQPWQPVAEGVSVPGAPLAVVVTDPLPVWSSEVVVTGILADSSGEVYARSVRVGG